MKKVFHYLLFITFLFTILIPFTGIAIHKLSSTLFLILSFIHLIIYSNKLNIRRILLMIMILICFITGILGMIFDLIPIILNVHKGLSVLLVFFLAIHIYVYHKKMRI